MNLGILVNAVETEKPFYTTTRFARAAVARGHEVYYIGAGDFAYLPSGEVLARAHKAPEETADSEDFMDRLVSGAPEKVGIGRLDALMLRNDSSEDLPERPWAASAGIVFGHALAKLGAVVVNDPGGLARAANKLYLHEFPHRVRPRTLISRDEDEVKSFIEDLSAKAVVKPLHGAKGEGVFFVQGPDDPNLNQIISSVREQGYIVAQQLLAGSKEGDVRFFMLEGKPLQLEGKFAAFRRRPAEDDWRSNMSMGGSAEPFEVTETVLQIADAIGRKLAEDGMFLAGLDIVGDRLVEVNVESPGGLDSVERFTGVDFGPVVIGALEEQVRARKK